MLTVVGDAKRVEMQLVNGGLECPCSGVLGPWGSARRRAVRDGDRRVVVRPRRGRCRACRMTHVLLPATLLLRRWYVAAVIGGALIDAAAGVAVAAVARMVGVPRSTVRGWVDRFRPRAERLRAHFTAWAVWLDGDRIDPAGSPVGDAVAALVVAATAAQRRLGIDDLWSFAAAATAGRLLCNTTRPFPAPWTGSTLPPS
jgi:hypothetical protein